ncbi:MAG: SAM-dependent methyltransferase [Acidimicrobiia bacterium]
MNLKQRILAEIAAGGPMPFERFMEMALYDAEGFFGGDRLRSDKGGDFLTSPEVSPLFGETLATWVRSVHARIGDPFQVVEVAAGSGSLLRPLLAEMDVEAIAVEVSPAARAALSGLAAIRERLPTEMRGVLIANELLDNLPMALAQRVDGGWRERWVGEDDGDLVFVDVSPRERVVEWLHAYAGPVEDGGWVEVQLEARAWLADSVSRLGAGGLLLFDYGDLSDNLLPRRIDGTLRTYRAHHLGPHPLDEPGETDITADVNFSALVDVAPNSRLHRQDDFLAGLGLRERLSALRRLELEAARVGNEAERLALRTTKTEVETLLHPRGLGDFRVLEITVP